MSKLTIGIVAKKSGVGVETIRFYERQGLIDQPHRPVSGFRNYPEDAIRRVRFIRRAKDLGFSLHEIGELLDLSLDPDQNCDEVRLRAEIKIADINSRVDALEKMKKALNTLVAACDSRNQKTHTCPIIE